MSAFATNSSLPGLMHDPEPIRAAKEAATDALVARTRAATPPGVAEMRRQPRLSVAEMNNQDWDTLRERFLATRRDDRPSWVRVLDAIDAPRNQILSHLAPGLERKARESGETAAFGTGRVNFSDVLGEAGLKPGVIRAIVGFVGDLALDPLTYIGAPAVGLKVANKAGQGVGIGVRGTRELTGGLFREGAIKAVKRGGLGAVKAGKTRDLLEAAARTAAPGLDNAGLASHLSSRVLGAPTQGRLGRAFSRVGGALEHEGGILANYGEFGLAGQLDDEARAARAFVAEYGAGAGPGVRLGKNATRAIAHIPFTDIGLHVPAFTDKAKYAADSLKVANQTGTVDPYAARGPGVTAAAATVQKMRDIEDAIKTGKMPVRGWEERVVASPMPAAAPKQPWEMTKDEAVSSGLIPVYRGVDEKGYSEVVSTPGGIHGDGVYFYTNPHLAKSHATWPNGGVITGFVNPNDVTIHGDVVVLKDASKFIQRGRIPLSDTTLAGEEWSKRTEQAISEGRAAPTQPAGGTPVYHYSDKTVDAYDNRPGGAWFTSNPKTYPRGKGTVRNEAFIDPKTLRLASKKDATNAGMFRGGTDWIDALKAQGFDGVKMTVDGDVHYNIFDPKNIGRASAQLPMGPPEPMRVKVPIHATTDDLLSELDQHRIDLERIISGANGGNKPQGIDAATPKDIGELLSLKQLIRQADAAAESAKARAAAFTEPNHPGAVAARSVEDAERNLRDSIRGAATNWAAHDPEKVRFVQRLVGADDPVTGSSLLGSVARAASGWRDGGMAAEILHRGDQSMKATLGQPGGMLRSMWRYLQNTMSTGRRERYISLERELRGQVLDAMEAAGIDRTVTDYQKAADIVTAHMAVARNEAARVAAEQAAQLSGSPLAAPSDMRFFLTDNNGKPLKWVENLVNAQKSGYFSKAHGSGLHDALRDIAAKNNDLLDSLGDAEFSDEILGARLLDYLPNSTTTGGRARMSAQKEYAVKRGASRGKAGKLASESFQKARTSRQYRFVDGAGKKQQFFDFDRWATTFDENELEQLAKEDPDTADHVRELGQAIREYDARAKADPQWAADNAPRNTHPAEMNQLAREGRFSLLLGGDPVPGGDFMDTNVASMMAARAMAHESSVAQRDWLDFVDGGMRVAVDPKKFQGHRMGDNLVLKDGTVAKTFRDPRSQKPGIEILGQRYRPLSDSFGAKDNPIVQGIGDTKAYLYHEDLARLLEESAKVYDQQGPELLKFLDAATAAWKTQSLMHPSWTIANLVGDSINYLTGGVRIADLAKNAAPLARVFANLDNPDALRGIELNIRGVPVTGEKFVNDLRAQRLIGNNAAAETVLQMNNRGIFYMPSHVRKGKKGWAGVKQALNPKTIASDISTLKGSFLQNAAHQSAAARLAAGAKASGFVARERLVNGLISPWFRSNEVMQDYMRAMAYASHLEQGHDIPMAVRKTIDSGFDYSDLTRVERNVFRRLFPFYSWMKNNGAYQLKQLMDRPIYTGMYPLLLNAAEEAINGDQQIPLHARPGWMRNQLALMVGKDPNRQALMLGSGLPVEQALVALEPLLGGPEGVQDFLKYFTTSTNTLLRAPAEIGVGREFFTDRTIGPQGDIGAGEYVANQFRPYREFNKVGETFEKHGAVPAAARVLLGGRLQGADDERLRVSKLREFKAEEERIRRQIATAGYRNDAKASVRARANQLALYRDMITAGFESDTPVWAREQLSQLAAGPGA